MRRFKIDKILLIYGIILVLISLFIGKFFILGNEMGYGVLFFYFLIPLSSFITNLLSSSYGGLMKYLFLILYPIFGIALPMIVFTNTGYNSISLYFGLIPSIAGFILGTFLKILRNIRNKKKQ